MEQEVKTKKYIETVYRQKKEFTIIALTGKVRAGTSDVCKLLTNPKFSDYITRPANTQKLGNMSKTREYLICYRYLHHNWVPFIEINVAGIILFFAIEAFESGEIKKHRLKEKILEIVEHKSGQLLLDACNKLSEINRILKQDGSFAQNELETRCKNIIEEMKNLLGDKAIRKAGKKIKDDDSDYKKECFCLYFGILPVMNEMLKEDNSENEEYFEWFQEFGNSIRAYGKVIHNDNNDIEKINADNIFCIPRKINFLLKLLRHYDDIYKTEADGKSNPVNVVINVLKNPYETFYFRCRYPTFYVLAVTCDENDRRMSFFNRAIYDQIETNENLALDKRKFLENGHSEKEDKLRIICHENNLGGFILQDVMKCIENADLFLTRDYKEKDYMCDYNLCRQLGRFITLMFHPGLLTPTDEERCMQIAMTAKINSGCLSRQVGAVITNKEYQILSIGWNDSPCGSESCIRRNLFDLFRKQDPEAYSEYELNDSKFRSYIDEVNEQISENDKSAMRGVPYAFCFKDIYQDILKQKDQIYTRALHGEERAIQSCSSEN